MDALPSAVKHKLTKERALISAKVLNFDMTLNMFVLMVKIRVKMSSHHRSLNFG